nr:putative reverse transcriptase, RNA-dependent DNA polymerase [Tanacetum cinerariifolium]
TLIEAARTLLADSLLPIPFLAEAINTACYVQNKVLVTKPQNKTPYELLHGSGPTWLFDIDTLSKTMTYQPVTAGKQSKPSAGVQEQFDAKTAGEEIDQQYVLFLVWSFGFTNPQNTNRDDTFDEKAFDFNEEKPESEVNVSPSSSAQAKKHDDKTKKEAKGKSHVESFTRYRNLSAEFEDFFDNIINEDNAAVCACARFQVTPKASHLHAVKRIFRYLKGKPHLGLWYPKDSPFDLVAYSDSDYAGASLDRKSTTEGCQFFRCRLISWQCKKQTVVGLVATSSTEAEYVAAASCCVQVLWIQNQLLDYGMESLKRMLHVINILSVGYLTTPQMVLNLPCLTHIKNWLVQIKWSLINNDDFHTCMFACFLLQEEPKRVHQALKDPSWIEAMQKELLQFKIQKVRVLVDLPHGKRAIGTKWFFRNKKDERGIVIRNKARLVTQGHTQEEGIDYEEVFDPVTRIEAIRLFLAYASFMGFMMYQMDVKSAFLYGTIKEEAYVCQPPGFEDLDYLDKVYKVVKAIYGLHQAPRAWYKTLANYLLENGF